MGLFSALSEELLLIVNKGVNSVSYELVKEAKDHRYKSEFIDPNKFLSKHNNGFCLDGKQCLSITSNHVLLVGSTGTGKTANIVIPSILKSNHNMIINDTSGELWQKTSAPLSTKSYRTIAINLGDASKSISWNPLYRVTTKSDVNKIAKMLVDKQLGQSKEQFWSLASSSIISLIIQIQMTLDTKYKTLANTLHLCEQLTFNPNGLDNLVVSTENQQIINEYKKFLSYDGKLKTNILATACAALSIFSDPEIAKVTSDDTLEIDDLRKGKFAIYIHTDTLETSYYSVLVSVFMEQMCKLLMSALPQHRDSYVQFIMDEFPTMTYLPSMQTIISNIRKYQGNILLICQDFSQIEHIYGQHDAQAIRNNCTSKLYLAGSSFSVARDVSQELGKYEYTRGEQRIVRNLLEHDEVRTISADEAILLHGNAQPMRLKLTPYYENPMMRLKSEMASITLDGDAEYNEVVLINADE